jgi:hypothetical protein
VLKFDGGSGQIWSGSSGPDFGNVEVKADTVKVTGDLVSYGLYSTQKGLRSLEPELKLSVTKSDGSTPEVLNVDSVGTHVSGNLEVDGDVEINGLTVIPVPWRMEVDSPETIPIPHLEYNGDSTVFKAIARGCSAADTVGLGWNMEDKKIDVFGDLEVEGKLVVADSVHTNVDTLRFTGSEAWAWGDNATLDNLGNVEVEGGIEIGGFVQLSGDFAFEKTTDPGEISVHGSSDTTKLSLSPSGVLLLDSDTDRWILDYNRGSDTLENKTTGFKFIEVKDSDAQPGTIVRGVEDSGGNGNNENWNFGGTDTIEGRLSNNAGTEHIDIIYALGDGDVTFGNVDRFGLDDGRFNFDIELDTNDKEIILMGVDDTTNDTSRFTFGLTGRWELDAGYGSIVYDDLRSSECSYVPGENSIKWQHINADAIPPDTLGIAFDFDNWEVSTNGLLHSSGGLRLSGNTLIESEGPGPLIIRATSGGPEEIGTEYDPSIWTIRDHANSWTLDGGVPIGATTSASMDLGVDRVIWSAEDLSGLGGFMSVELAPNDSTAFGGAMHVRGFLDAEGLSVIGPKLFKIDHPVDPENKYLSHSCVESPEMMNVYAGTAKTNADGFAEIQLPGYFTALNKDYRYQLTVIGQTFARAVIWKEIDDNGVFTIRSEEPDLRVSWQVTGVRNDRYARENPLQVEIEKEPGMKGKLLYE